MNNELEFILVREKGKNLDKISIYVDILKEIFSKDVSDAELDSLLGPKTTNKLYIVCYQNEPIGITGLYWGDEEGICWVNWYGILEKYRSKDFGTKILLQTFEFAKEKFSGIRLYTDDDCYIAINYVYPKYFDFSERIDDITVFSKSFTHEKLKKYNKKAYGII